MFFFSFFNFFNYTSKCLKVLCLRMETSGAAGKEMGTGDKRGARDAPGMFFFVIHYYYTNKYIGFLIRLPMRINPGRKAHKKGPKRRDPLFGQ